MVEPFLWNVLPSHLRLKGLSAPRAPFILSAAANDLLYQVGAVGLEVLVKHFLKVAQYKCSFCITSTVTWCTSISLAYPILSQCVMKRLVQL